MYVRLTVLFMGHVQGVGFRYTACRVAESHDVTGQVRNLPDGRVEMIVEGTSEAANGMVQAVQDEMASHVRQVATQQSGSTGQYDGFRIAYFD